MWPRSLGRGCNNELGAANTSPRHPSFVPVENSPNNSLEGPQRANGTGLRASLGTKGRLEPCLRDSGKSILGNESGPERIMQMCFARLMFKKKKDTSKNSSRPGLSCRGLQWNKKIKEYIVQFYKVKQIHCKGQSFIIRLYPSYSSQGKIYFNIVHWTTRNCHYSTVFDLKNGGFLGFSLTLNGDDWIGELTMVLCGKI